MVFSTSRYVNRIVGLFVHKLTKTLRRALIRVLVTNLRRTNHTVRKSRHRHATSLHRRHKRKLRILTIIIDHRMVTSRIFSFFGASTHFLSRRLIGLRRINNKRATFFTLQELSATSRTHRNNFSVRRNQDRVRRRHVNKFTLTLNRTLRRHRLVSSSFAQLPRPRRDRNINGLTRQHRRTTRLQSVRTIATRGRIRTLLSPCRLFTRHNRRQTRNITIETNRTHPLLVSRHHVKRNLIRLMIVFRHRRFHNQILNLNGVGRRTNRRFFKN